MVLQQELYVSNQKAEKTAIIDYKLAVLGNMSKDIEKQLANINKVKEQMK